MSKFGTLFTGLTPLFLGLVAINVVASGCSLMFSFEPDGRPCGPDQDNNGELDCLPGNSCRINVCIPDGSVELGETCTTNKHCAANARCTLPDNTCRQTCQSLYLAGECSPNEACIVAVDSDNKRVGVCRPSECSNETECSAVAPPLCFQAKNDVGICLEACTVNCAASPCVSTCPASPSGQQQHCQPIGPPAALVTACLPRDPTDARNHGSSCNLANGFCAAGTACITSTDGRTGFCLKYCKPGDVSACDGLSDNPWNPGQTPTCSTITPMVGVCGQLPPGF